MKWQLLSSGAQSSQRGEGGRGRGSWQWEGEGAPPWSPCHEKLWDREGGRSGGGGAGPCGEGSQACRSQVVTCSAAWSHHFLRYRTTQPFPPEAGGGRVLQGSSTPVVPPCPLPTSFFHCPAHKGLEGPAAPSPTPSPKARAPWQRPRRQGGVCQRHLSLTSSLTGHQGNTHDSTQEGLPVQPSFFPSIGPQLSPNWKPPFLWDWRSPNSLFQLQVPGSTRQRLLDPGAWSNPQHMHTNTQQHPCPQMHDGVGDSGMLLSPAPEPVRAWKQAGRGRHVHTREQAHTARLTRTGRAVRPWTHRW